MKKLLKNILKSQADKYAEKALFSPILEKDKSQSFPYIEALAKTGQTEKALELLSKKPLKNIAVVKRILAFLGSLYPEKIIPMIQNHKEYDVLSCAIKSLTSTPEDYTNAHDLLSVRTALQKKDFNSAQTRLDTFFKHHDLEPFLTVKTDTPHIRLNIPPSTECNIAQDKVISIIMTAYNEKNYIRQSVESLQAQSYRNFELIIVDDGSTDNTRKIIKTLADKEKRIKVLFEDHNIGTWSCKNRALLIATGDFIICHDADDWAHPRKLENQIKPLIDDNTLQATSSYFFRICEKSGIPFSRIIYPLQRWNPSSLMYRRSAFNKMGGYYGALLGGDCEIANRLECIFGKQSHVRIKQPLSVGSYRENSLTTNTQTGLKSGYNEIRQTHWEAWQNHHEINRKNIAALFVDPDNNLNREPAFFLPETKQSKAA